MWDCRRLAARAMSCTVTTHFIAHFRSAACMQTQRKLLAIFRTNSATFMTQIKHPAHEGKLAIAL